VNWMHLLDWSGWGWQFWLAAGAVMVIVDAFIINTAVIMWFGIGAGLVAALLYIHPGLSGLWQLGVFGASSPLALLGWKWWDKKRPRKEPDSPHLNKKGAEYIGRVFPLEGAMENGVGRIKIGDTSWTAKSNQNANLPAGGKVLVEEVRGTTIIVKKFEEQT